MDAVDDLRQQAVPRHRVEHARLPEQHDEDHGGQARDRAQLDEGGHPAEPRPVRRNRDRIGDVELLVRDHTRRDSGDEDVQHGADEQ